MRRLLCTCSATVAATALVAFAWGQAPGPSPARVGGRPAHEVAAEQRALAEEALEALRAEVAVARTEPFGPAAVAWNRRLAEAKLALARTPAERAAAIEPYVAFLKERVGLARAEFEVGKRTALDVLDARYDALEAERWQAREGAN